MTPKICRVCGLPVTSTDGRKSMHGQQSEIGSCAYQNQMRIAKAYYHTHIKNIKYRPTKRLRYIGENGDDDSWLNPQ